MNCNYQRYEKVQEFCLDGKLDQESYALFDGFIRKNYVKDYDVILNLEKLDYISSVGLRSLIGLAKLVRVDKKNINVKAKENSMVRQLIILSGFTRMMPFIGSE